MGLVDTLDIRVDPCNTFYLLVKPGIKPLNPFLPAGANNHIFTVCLIIYSYEVRNLTLCSRDEYVPAMSNCKSE